MDPGRPSLTVSTSGQYPAPVVNPSPKPRPIRSAGTPVPDAAIRKVGPLVEAVPAGAEQEVEAQAAEVEVLLLPLRPQ